MQLKAAIYSNVNSVSLVQVFQHLHHANILTYKESINCITLVEDLYPTKVFTMPDLDPDLDLT